MQINNKKILEELLELIEKYFDRRDDSDAPVVDFKTPQELKQQLNLVINEEGDDYDALLGDVETYLKYAVSTGHSQFFNQLFGGFNFPAFLGEIVTAASNTSMYTYEVSPVATLIELELTKKMCGIAGFELGEGIFLTGGSNANLLALTLARNSAYPDIRAKGVASAPPLRLFASDKAHYSFEQAVHVTGMGLDSLIKVKTGYDGAMIPEELEKEISKCIARGEKPVMIAATAGTTMIGSFDPVREISRIAKKFGVWLHVDGSWGGSLLLSRKQRTLLDGVESADSLAWNPHKLMNIPLVCSTLLLRKTGILESELSTTGRDYLFHDGHHADHDIGTRSLQCGRRVDSLKLWLAWRYYGDTGYERNIDRLVDAAKYFAELIKADSCFELYTEPKALNVCFRYIALSAENMNEFNLQLRNELLTSGQSMVNYGTINGEVYIRLVLVNNSLTKKNMDKFYFNLCQSVETLEQKNKKLQ